MTADRPEPSPREIVARLHERIAAQSPDHAALVAAYQRTRAAMRVPPGPVQVFPRSPRRSRLARQEAYAALRGAGTGRKDAAALVGVCRRTADRYEDALSGDRT